MYCEVRVKSQHREGLGEEGVYSCVEERRELNIRSTIF